jgi:hypothetical protein
LLRRGFSGSAAFRIEAKAIAERCHDHRLFARDAKPGALSRAASVLATATNVGSLISWLRAYGSPTPPQKPITRTPHFVADEFNSGAFSVAWV